MKRFFLVLSLYGSTAMAARSSDVLGQVCFNDLNLCAIVAVDRSNGWLTEIRFKMDDLKRIEAMDPGIANTYIKEFGVLARGFEHDYYDRMVAKIATTTYLNHSTAIDSLENHISDEAWKAMFDAGGCAAGAVSCVAAVESALATGGLAFFAMKFGCAYTGMKCANAIRSYQKWQQTQVEIKKEDEKKKEGSSEGGHSSGGATGGHGSASSAASTGGWYYPGAAAGGHSGMVTISEQ